MVRLPISLVVAGAATSAALQPLDLDAAAGPPPCP